MRPLSALHHAALTVRSRNESADWYRSVLGLEELFREAGTERRACVMGFAGGGFAVGVVEHIGHESSFDPRRAGLDHLSFTVADRDELDLWGERLAAAGVEHSGVVEVPSGALLNFADPDGIALSLFWDRP
jgi:glyoxylase I family protein